MKIQERALLSLVNRGEAVAEYDKILHKTIYKIKVDNPWVKSRDCNGTRKEIPQIEVHTP